MGISLLDDTREDVGFDVNFWHWRALIEAVRRLAVLPDDRVAALHEPLTGAGLDEQEARCVADALEHQLLPTLHDNERLLIDGGTTTEPDSGTLYRCDETAKNYSTNRRELQRFIAFLRETSGFTVN